MMPFPDKKYQIIYADPPWVYQDKSKSHGGGQKVIIYALPQVRCAIGIFQQIKILYALCGVRIHNLKRA